MSLIVRSVLHIRINNRCLSHGQMCKTTERMKTEAVMTDGQYEQTFQCWYGYSVHSVSLVQFSVFHIKTFRYAVHQTKKCLKKLVTI